MTCLICKHGETRPGTTTVTLERDGLTLVVRSVPADVCEACGEEYVSEEVSARLFAQAEAAARRGVQVEIRDYLAA